MKNLSRGGAVVLWSLMLLAVSGCGGPQDTIKELQNEVSAYAAAPSDEAAAEIDGMFTRLDGQIGQLRESGDAAGADALAKQRDALQAQYVAAQMTASLLRAKDAAAGIGEAFRKAGEAFGQAIKGDSGEAQ